MNLRNKIKSEFSSSSLEHALFYHNEGGLRFELSVGGSFIQQFTDAFNKASEIMEDVSSNSNELAVCIMFYSSGSFLSSLSVFRGINELGIIIPKNYESWAEEDSEESDLYKIRVLFSIKKEDVHLILWNSAAQDMGVTPRYRADTFIIDFENNVISHVYDDRGMDIIGPNKKILKSLYDKFNGYLLDYDREEMDAHYKSL